MEMYDNLFNILDEHHAVGGVPSDRTLRIAKALGMGAVLFVDDNTAEAADAAREAVEAQVRKARFIIRSVRLAKSDDDISILRDALSSMPKPVLIVAHDRHAIHALASRAIGSQWQQPVTSRRSRFVA